MNPLRSKLGLFAMDVSENLPSPIRTVFQGLARKLLFGAEKAEYAAEADMDMNPERLMKMKRDRIDMMGDDANQLLEQPASKGRKLVDPKRRRSQGSMVDMSVLTRQNTLPGLYDDAIVQGHENAQRTLYLFTKDGWVRLLCQNVSESFWFTMTILGTIALSCAALALEPPTRDHEPAGLSFAMLDVINLVTTAIFTVEFAIQAVNMGLIMPKDAYLRNAWNAVRDSIYMLCIYCSDISPGNCMPKDAFNACGVANNEIE